MAELKHLLVHVDSTAASEARLALAFALGRRVGARVTGLFAESESLGASIVGRRSPELFGEAARHAQDRFETHARAAGADAEWWSVGLEAHGELLGSVTACCRYVDLAIFSQPIPGDRLPPDALERVLAESGRPVLVVPAESRLVDVGRRIVVGWNASRGSVRALSDALPFLLAAEFVGLLSFQASTAPGATGGPPADIIAHLALHGVRPSYTRAVEGVEGLSVADALLNHAFESRADLIVTGVQATGAFRHGGFALRELLASMTVPLLLAD